MLIQRCRQTAAIPQSERKCGHSLQSFDSWPYQTHKANSLWWVILQSQCNLRHGPVQNHSVMLALPDDYDYGMTSSKSQHPLPYIPSIPKASCVHRFSCLDNLGHTKANLCSLTPQPATHLGQILTWAIKPLAVGSGSTYITCRLGRTSICKKKPYLRFSHGSFFFNDSNFLHVTENETVALQMLLLNWCS